VLIDLLIPVWVAINLFAIWWVDAARKQAPTLAFGQYFELLIPFYSKWGVGIGDGERAALRRYRWRLQVWCYCVLLAPLLVISLSPVC
jgi:hypothetical protein